MRVGKQGNAFVPSAAIGAQLTRTKSINVLSAARLATARVVAGRSLRREARPKEVAKRAMATAATPRADRIGPKGAKETKAEKANGE